MMNQGNATVQEQLCSMCTVCRATERLNDICLTCAMAGICMRQSTLLTSLLEDDNEVHMLVEEDNKPTVSEVLVDDSGASVHVTNCKHDLNELETTSQAITIRSGKLMAA